MLSIARFDQPAGPLPVPMALSDATGLRLLSHGHIGADLIRFPAGGCVPDHTHPGPHMLFVLTGVGWVDYDGEPTRLIPGLCYLIPCGVRHGIRAETELTLLAIAGDHRDVGSPDRLSLVEEAPC